MATVFDSDAMPLGQKVLLWASLLVSFLCAGALIYFGIIHAFIHVLGVIAAALFFLIFWPFVLFMVGRWLLDRLRGLFGKEPVNW